MPFIVKAFSFIFRTDILLSHFRRVGGSRVNFQHTLLLLNRSSASQGSVVAGKVGFGESLPTLYSSFYLGPGSDSNGNTRFPELGSEDSCFLCRRSQPSQSSPFLPAHHQPHATSTSTCSSAPHSRPPPSRLPITVFSCSRVTDTQLF